MEEQVMETKKRPTFITVLGILGFIGVGWQIISGIITMGAGAVTSAVTSAGSSYAEGLSNIEGMENAEGMDQAMAGLNEAVDAANKLAQNATILGIINIVAALVCLLGIIWMWKLQKKGFFVYVIGEIAAPVATLVLVGFGLGGFMATLGFIFPIIFIILWGLNLKHMS
ncbi:MAG TPA: hypothetical protein PLP65_04530 [Bacteroidales bacterium]|jgi:hypothetical protein|nr:hypothetical protein [Bacteroidales bacterium]